MVMADKMFDYFWCCGITVWIMSQHTLEICKCKYFVTLDKYLSCMRFLSGGTVVTWPNGRAAQLCRSRSCPLQQSCRCVQHGPTHVLSSLHFKSSPVFVSSLYCKKASRPCWTAVQQTCNQQLIRTWELRGGAVTRKSQFAIRPLLVRLYTPDLVLCGNQF